MNKRGAEQNLGEGARSPSAGQWPKKPLRILVVEDDPQALAATTSALEALGHFAAGASSAEVARSRFLDGAFDVLMTDISLPGLSGEELVQDIRRDARAPLEVIYATGRQRPSGSGANWLQKPYQLEQLESALDQARQRLRDQYSQRGQPTNGGRIVEPEGC